MDGTNWARIIHPFRSLESPHLYVGQLMVAQGESSGLPLMDLTVSNDAWLVEYSMKRDENMCRGRCPRWS